MAESISESLKKVTRLEGCLEIEIYNSYDTHGKRCLATETGKGIIIGQKKIQCYLVRPV